MAASDNRTLTSAQHINHSLLHKVIQCTRECKHTCIKKRPKKVFQKRCSLAVRKLPVESVINLWKIPAKKPATLLKNEFLKNKTKKLLYKCHSFVLMLLSMAFHFSIQIQIHIFLLFYFNATTGGLESCSKKLILMFYLHKRQIT